MTTSVAAAEAEVRTLQAEIEELRDEHRTLKARAKDLRRDAARDGIQAGSPEFDELDAAYRAADDTGELLSTKRDELVAATTEQLVHMRTALAAKKRQTMPVGVRYTDSDVYRAAVQAVGGRFGQHDTLPRVEVASVEETTAFLASSGVGLVPTDERLTGVPIPRRGLSVLDLINVASTNTDAVEVARQSTRTNNAAPTAHATGNVGVASPESIFEWEKVTLPVRRIAHHSIQPRSMLADAGRLQNLISGELTYGIRLVTENQVLTGAGTGQQFNGIVTQAAQDQTHSNASDVLADSVHKAMTLVRIAFESDVTGVVMHPTDYEDFVLEKDGVSGGYLSGNGQFAATPPSAWGYPVVVSTALAAGTILVGRFAEATLYVRSGVEIMSGFINQQLIEDLTTIAGEYRAAFGIMRPDAFATVTRGA